MPTEILAPDDGGNFGPGVDLTFRDTTPGPFPGDDRWVLEEFGGPTFEQLERRAEMTFVAGSVNVQWLMPSPFFDLVWTHGESGRVTTGLTTRIIVRHTDVAGVVRSQDSIDVKWQETVGTGQQLFDVAANPGGTEGGYTEEDRQTADATLDSTQMAFPATLPNVGALLQGVVNGVQALGPQLLRISDCVTITGRGELTRPGGPFPVNAYGLTWFFDVVPPQLSRLDGVLVEYDERVLQLVRVNHDITNTEYAAEVLDLHSDGGRMVWGIVLPSRILYDVLPGCEVRICWLTLIV